MTNALAADSRYSDHRWDGSLFWQYIPEGQIPHHRLMGPHHDVWRKNNGNTLLICREAVPDECLKEVRNPLWQNQTICGDTILEVNPSGEVVWEWHSHGHLDINHYRLLASPGWFAGPHNSTSGDYFGGLSGQHEPYMIPKGWPGAGNIMIFDNGASPWKDLGHAGMSYVLEVDPMTKELVWVYDAGQRFHSTYTSSAQRLLNGNTLICEAAASRVFEVDPEANTVWEFVGCGPRSYRYPYDYCPQTAALETPTRASVTPPEELRIPPDTPLD